MRPLTMALTFGLAILWTGGNAGAAKRERWTAGGGRR